MAPVWWAKSGAAVAARANARSVRMAQARNIVSSEGIAMAGRTECQEGTAAFLAKALPHSPTGLRAVKATPVATTRAERDSLPRSERGSRGRDHSAPLLYSGP